MTYRVLRTLGIGLAVVLLALSLFSMADDFSALAHLVGG
jgi:hypothetical protein